MTTHSMSRGGGGERRSQWTYAPALIAGLNLLVCCLPQPTSAQDGATSIPGRGGAAGDWSQDRGVVFGAQLITNLIDVDPEPDSDPGDVIIDDVGHGILLFAGYAFTPSFDLRVTLDAALHGTTRADVTATHSTGAFTARYRFLPDRHVRPYLFGGLGGTALQLGVDGVRVRVTGDTAVMGGGLLAHLTRWLALDVSARLDLVNWSDFEVEVELPDGSRFQVEEAIEASDHSAKIQLGLSVHL